MKLTVTSSYLLVSALVASSQLGYVLGKHGADMLGDSDPFTTDRPNDATLINDLAFPNWCLKGGDGADAEDRVSCNDAAKGEANGTINRRLFNPIYLTKKYSGAAQIMGGHPTNTDIQYVYEFAGPFLGQAGGGTADQCPQDFDGTRNNFKQCGKLNTINDDGPYGPGHVPPHIAVAAIKFCMAGEGNGVTTLPVVPDETWFDFPTTGCRITTSVLFDCLRTFYPRTTPGEVLKYPPPFTKEGGDYQLEFVNKVGESCASEKLKFPSTICFEEHSGGGPENYPDYIKQGGGPHYCSKIAVEADANDGWCPYLFFGPNRGQYRHPHIAYAALETYIAHLVIPDKCGTAWDDSRFPAAVDTTVAWPVETEVTEKTNNQADFQDNVLPSPNQPKTVRRRIGKSSKSNKGKLTFVWPNENGFQKKPVIGQFSNTAYVGE